LAASRTRWRVAAEMAEAPGALFMTSETVAGERLRCSARNLRLTGFGIASSAVGFDFDLRVGMNYPVDASGERVAGRGGLRPWWLVGRALEDDDVKAFQGYGVGVAAVENVFKGGGKIYGLRSGVEVDEDPDFVVGVRTDVEIDSRR
jgi:hypothetical protein